jgi:dipeptidyl-peptidase-4
LAGEARLGIGTPALWSLIVKSAPILLCLIVAVPAFAQKNSFQLPTEPYSIERLSQYPLLQGRSPAGAAMAPDGSKIVFGWNQTGERKLDLWVMDFPSGRKRMIVEAKKIEDLPRQDDSRTELEKQEATFYDGGIGGAKWSPDSRELIFSYKGRVWLCGPGGENLHALVDANEGLRGVSYSPDGRYLAYLQNQNVYRIDRKSLAVKQLTFVSKGQTSVNSFDWSPDSKNLLVQWSDFSKIGHGVMIDFSKDRGEVVNIQREWNGDLSTNLQIGVVPADGGLIKFVEGVPRYCWVKSLEWSPESNRFSIGYISDDFMSYTLAVVPLKTLKKADVYTEKAPKNYINDWRPQVWSRDGKRLILGTDILDKKLTYRSVVAMDADGKNLTRVYAESHDVGSLMRPKDSDRLFLGTAGKSPLSCEITILEPDGKRTAHEVVPNGYSVPKNFDDAGLPLVSDDGRRVATMASNRKLSPELYAVEPGIKRLTESQLPAFSKITMPDVEEVTFPGPGGVTMHGLLITKPGFDRSRPHPAVVSNIYADSAKESWGGLNDYFMATNLDFAVLCVDFRASWGYGGEFDSGYYKQMGLIDADEAVAAKNYLAGLPFVRKDRVGIWGWSYGGYLTCMTLLTKPGVYDTGVAVASVTDWTTYNEWYTRRRLGLVKDDKAIFAKTSPITYASGLEDHLLLIHGILDDNVLFQNTGLLAEKLIEAGKYFDLFVFPRDDHSISKDKSRPEVMGKVMRYLYEKLSRP